MGAAVKIESMNANDRALWECVPGDRYAEISDIERACHKAEVPVNRPSILAKLHHFRKRGWVDGHENQGRWLFRRNDPRARPVPALVGTIVPPKETPEEKMLSEIDSLASAALDLADRAEKLKANLTDALAAKGRVSALEEENRQLKAELERLVVFKAAFKAALED